MVSGTSIRYCSLLAAIVNGNEFPAPFYVTEIQPSRGLLARLENISEPSHVHFAVPPAAMSNSDRRAHSRRQTDTDREAAARSPTGYDGKRCRVWPLPKNGRITEICDQPPVRIGLNPPKRGWRRPPASYKSQSPVRNQSDIPKSSNKSQGFLNFVARAISESVPATFQRNHRVGCRRIHEIASVSKSRPNH